MTSSLAEQLQRLALPQTSVLEKDKKKASILFEPKDAAGLKRDTVYQIGLEGLEELIQKNDVFEKFSNSLFHVTSKDLERSVQTQAANDKLDEHISEFLLMLSPYFLLNCSQKCLEWLVNRFHIHEYNREDLLMLILPYHETNIFVRVLQLLKFKDANDSFYFLKPLQKPGVQLPKQGLINHAMDNSGFLKFLARYILELVKVHPKPNVLTVAFNFYCTVFLGVLEYSSKITEDQISQMLPAVLKGLNSSVADFCAASYVIVSRLVTKTTLSNKLLDAFVERISEIRIEGLRIEATLVFVVLYQSQLKYTNLPPAAVANLAEKDWLPKILHNLNSAGCMIYPFFEKLLRRSAEEGLNNDIKLSRDLITKCLEQIKLDSKFVPTVIHSLLEAKSSKTKLSEDAQNWLTDTVEMLERQYPAEFDKEVTRILSLTENVDKKSKRKRNTLSKILKNSVTYKGKFEIFEKLYHPNPSLRSEAVKFLLDNYKLLKDTDRDIITNSFIDRLYDDNVEVVKETLDLIQKTLVLSSDVLRNVLINLAIKCKKQSDTWGVITKPVLQLLCTKYSSSDWLIFQVILPFLMPGSEDELTRSKHYLQFPFILEHDLFKEKINKMKVAKKPEELVRIITKSLGSNRNIDNLTNLIEALKQVPLEKRDCFHKYVAFFILSNILPENSSPEIGLMILGLYHIYSNEETIYLEGTAINDYIEASISGKLPIKGFSKCLSTIVNRMSKPQIDLTQYDFSNKTPETEFFIELSNILFGHSKWYRDTLQIFTKRFFDNLEDRINYLLNLCSSEHASLNKHFITNVLRHVEGLLDQAPQEEIKQFIYIEKLTPVWLLILLSNPNKSIREAIFKITSILSAASTRKSNSYSCLFESLLKNKEELTMDHQQVSLIMFNILDPISTKGKKHSAELNAIRNALIKLCSASDTTLYMKASILKMLSQINNFDILESTSTVALDILQQNSKMDNLFSARIVELVVKRIEPKAISKVDLSSEAWKLLEFCVTNDGILIPTNDGDISISTLVLNQLEKDIFTLLGEDVVKQLLNCILTVACSSKNTEVLLCASRIFKHIDLDAKLILDHFNDMRDVQSPKLDPNKKKRRVSVVPTIDILDTLEWKKGITLLEFIQDKKKIRNIDCLLQIFFELLKRCLDFDEQAAVEYPKQLLLSSILHCCQKSENGLPENVFNVEIIVQCIRASQNPQTHHQALLLLAHTANLIPTQVLHHIMAIFTFMGNSILRHDDAYSFQIIIKIIDTVIPILVEDGEESKIAKVLRVFVDAILDVPEHRRMPLYKQLLEKMNVKENLCIFLLLVVESQVLHSNQQKGKEEAQKRLDIATNLCYEFSPKIIIYNAIKLVKYLQGLPDEKNESAIEVGEECGTFNIATSTPKDFRHYKYLLLKFCTNLLNSQEFVRKVAVLTTEEELALEDLFKESIINILQFIQRISKVTDKAVNTPQAHYWKVILHLSYDILDSVNALVTAPMFLLITRGLMVHNLNTVRRRILELLNSKLQHDPEFFEECDKSEIYSLIPTLVNIVEGINETLEPEEEIIIQTALLSLKLLVKSLASSDPEKFVQILDFITNVLQSGKAQNNVLASVLLCLAELCIHLKAHAIGSLPDFMPCVTKILKHQKHEEKPSVLLRSIITTIEKIFDSMPLFMSPYLEKILVEMSLLVSRWGFESDEQNLQPFIAKLCGIKQKIGSIIPPRVLLPAVENAYDILIKKSCFKAISSLMDILSENMSNIRGTDINSNLPDITRFFLNALRFRADTESSLEDANEVESHIVKALTVLILKLSESSFRPLYYKLYDWAVRSEEKSERLITFYSLSSGIAKSLKGLFALFAGHFINNAADILDQCNKIKNDECYFMDDRKNILLLEYALKTLDSIFLYDSHKFINKDRFDILMQPLVDQLENTLGGSEELLKRNEELVTPCLVHFALATADDALWKQMNYQILLKMRHNIPKIRLITLHCLTEIVKKLGEDFLPLLPETIPFLSELLEDEEQDVEKACKKAVQEMEKVLGEPLQKYF